MICRHEILPALALDVFAAGAGRGLARLRFDVEVLNLLQADLPVVQGLKLYQQHFASARELVITVSTTDV